MINETQNVFSGMDINYSPQVQKKKREYIPEAKSDVLDISTATNAKENKSNNGKFDISEAAKNFVKGVISPLTAIKEHPLLTVGIVAGATVACTLIPVLTPIMAVGFGAMSVFQLGKGCYNTVKNYKNGNYDEAERSMKDVGQGAVGTALSFLGLKNSAKIAKEAKLMSELGTNTLTQAQREAIATEISDGSRLNALKEILSLFTTKSGLKATFTQFKPSMIHARYTEFVEAMQGKRPGKKKVEREEQRKLDHAEEFKKTPEGIRRSNLTDEQIEQEVNALYKKAFDELGIPEENRPYLKIKADAKTPQQGGSYSQATHSIEFNPESYKSGYFELDDIIMHEATHCKEALLRSGLPQDRVDEIVKNALIERIKNGESEKIIVKGNFFGPDMMEPPKMSQSMQDDFIQFASKELYKEDSAVMRALREYDTQMGFKDSIHFNSVECAQAQKEASPILEQLSAMLKSHPEFVEQYGSEEEALKVLTKYSISHNVRFSSFRNTGIGGVGYTHTKINVTLTPEQIKEAEMSLVSEIETIEGNGRVAGINSWFAGKEAFNQYQFSAEEVLAEQNGNKFFIKNTLERLEQMREAGTLTPEQEQYMTAAIDKAKMVIDYKTKGLEYYKLYTQMINEPNNQQLAETVKLLGEEIEAIGKQITPEEFEIIKQIIEIPDHLKPDILTRGLPANISVVPDIFADMIEKNGNK